MICVEGAFRYLKFLSPLLAQFLIYLHSSSLSQNDVKINDAQSRQFVNELKQIDL